MSVYNAEKYLERAVKSILNQSFEDFEFVIVDDASQDNSMNMLKYYATVDNRICIKKNGVNLGLTRSLNIAIRSSKGDFIARMDADDISKEDRLERQIEYMYENPDAGILGTSFYEIDEGERIKGEIYMPADNNSIRKRIYKANPFCHSSIMIRRVCFNNVGLYNEGYLYAQDYELWFRILGKYRGGNLGELLVKRRKHKGALTKRNIKLQSFYAYRACIEGKRHIKPRIVDYFHILRYKLLGYIPSEMTIALSALRPYILSSYYKKDLR